MTLRLKLFLLLAFITVLSTSGVTAVALWRDLERGHALLAREGASLAAAAAPAAARWLGPEGRDVGAPRALRELLGRLVDTAPLEAAWVVDRGGAVVACVDRSGRGCPPGAPALAEPLAPPADLLARVASGAGLTASAAVLRDGALAGAVRVRYPPGELAAGARRLAWNAAGVAALWIAIGQLAAMLLLGGLTRAIGRVTRASEALGRDEEAPRVPVPRDRELADLALAFNRMAERLAARRHENRELVATLERRVAEKTRDVLRADRLATLGGIAAGFAHELGNAVNVIRGYTAVAHRELPPEHPNRADLEAVLRESRRAGALLERFLVFARSRASHAVVQPLAPIVQDALDAVGPLASQARVAVELHAEPGAPELAVDAELLRQAFLNLALNAVQAMKETGGRLVARVGGGPDGAVVELADTGPGIAPAHLAHVFEPFYTTKAEGTGLGLAIVRQAAETHGGTVEAERAPGGGALFRMRLPARAGAPGEEER